MQRTYVDLQNFFRQKALRGRSQSMKRYVRVDYGIRRKIDNESYSIRFTSRRTGSTWSAINIKNVERLREHG